jgi:peptide/nickel transport system substrate-binding protein
MGAPDHGPPGRVGVVSTRTSRPVGAMLAFVLAVSLAACSGSSGGSGGTGAGQARLSIGAAAVPASLDPRKSSPYDAIWVGLLYDPLVRRAPDGTFEPGLAESWTFSEDMRVLDLTLRSGVTFQDGAPFNADAVKANLDAALAEPTNFTNHLSNLEAVEVVDADHVRLQLSDAGTPTLGVLAGEAGMIVSPQALAQDDLSTSPAGTGPFTLDGFTGPDIRFTKWDGYWDADAVKPSGIDVTVFLDESARVRALRSGQVDVGFIQPNQVEEVRAGGLAITSAPTADFFGVILNTGEAAFAESKVRQAMMLAVDRPALVQNVFGDGCVPSAQPFRPDDWAYAPGIEDSPAAMYDPQRARQLLAEAGYPDGFSFELQTNTMQTWTQIATVLQAQWGEIGLEVDVRPMENVQFVTARRNGEFASTLSTYQSARPDQSEFIKTFYLPGGLFNPSGYELPGVAELLAESSSSPDPGVREPPMHKIMTDVLNDGPPVIPICTRTTFYGYRDNVHGLEVSPLFDSNLAGVTVDGR